MPFMMRFIEMVEIDEERGRLKGLVNGTYVK